jgi:hypothetical protein
METTEKSNSDTNFTDSHTSNQCGRSIVIPAQAESGNPKAAGRN